MTRRRAITSLSLMCALLLCAVVAQAASAAGQTIFECSESATTKTFSDAHCDASGGSKYGHSEFPFTETEITLTNAGTRENTTLETIGILKISSLHGFSNVVVECTNIEGTGTAQNAVFSETMEGKGSGEAVFSNALGANCSTNQTGCTVAGGTAKEEHRIKVKAHTVAISSTEMGLKFEPSSGTKFTNITFEGTCGLHFFGAIPVEGSTIATEGGEPNGHGATAWFVEGSMNSLTVGGSSAQLIGKDTLKRKSTGNALVLTTD